MRDIPPQSPQNTPLFTPLGVYRAHGGLPRYYIAVNGELRVYRAWELRCVPFLLDIYPDHNHWRELFPKPPGKRIDTQSSGEWFVRACEAAGQYQPPAELTPRRAGRPLNAVRVPVEK